MKLKESFQHEFSFTQDNVNRFSEITGDNNPIHIDGEYASKTKFQKRVLHGFLSGSVFSKVFGTIWPGNGTVYLSQNMNFIKPMYPNEIYVAKFEVIEVLPKNKFVISTIIENSNNKNTIEGKAVIMFDNDLIPERNQ